MNELVLTPSLWKRLETWTWALLLPGIVSVVKDEQMGRHYYAEWVSHPLKSADFYQSSAITLHGDSLIYTSALPTELFGALHFVFSSWQSACSVLSLQPRMGYEFNKRVVHRHRHMHSKHLQRSWRRCRQSLQTAGKVCVWWTSRPLGRENCNKRSSRIRCISIIGQDQHLPCR